MSIGQGNWVSFEGKEAMIETTWGQGKHRMFKLSDGRVIADLDKLVESRKANQVEAPLKKVQFPGPEPKKKWHDEV